MPILFNRLLRAYLWPVGFWGLNNCQKVQGDLSGVSGAELLYIKLFCLLASCAVPRCECLQKLKQLLLLRSRHLQY